MMAFGIGASAQITVSESFEGSTLPTGWISTITGSGFSSAPSGYGTLAGTACAGTNAVYKNIYGTTYTSWYMTYSSTASNATALNYSFKYLAKGYSTTGDINGSVAADYSVDGGTTWNDLLTPVTLNSPNATPIPCTTVSGTIPAGTIPAGANFKFRLKSTSATNGDFYMGFDNVVLSQAATTAPNCVAISSPANAATGISLTPTITWPAAAGASSYVINMGTTPGGTQVMAGMDVGNTTSYTVPAATLAYSTMYYITIIPKNSFGLATGCTETSFTTLVIPCPTVTAPAAGATGISVTPTITWTALSGAAGYKLSVGTTSGGTDILNNLDLGNVTSYTFASALMSGTKYYYKLNSYSSTSNSLSCTERNFTTLCSAVASVPYTLDFEGLTTPSLPNCSLAINAGTGNNWVTASAPTDCPGFTTKVLQYGYDSFSAANAWFFTQGINLTGGTQYTITYKYGNNSTTYTEKLKVAYGNSAAVAAMTNVLADYPSINDKVAHSASVNFTPATSGTYYFGFNAYSATNQYNLYLDDISITATAVLATSEINDIAKNNIKVYPNPFSEVLNISDASDVKNVLITDVSGRVLKTIANPGKELHLGDLKQGMYLVTLEMKDGSKQTIKAIKK